MKPKIFLSHNHADKEFVRKLAEDLEVQGAEYWLDEAEIKIGDSLIKKIREGIDNVDFFAIILSSNSINSEWVKNELDTAMNYQIQGRGIKVLPLLLEHVELPSFLVGKLYCDFSEPSNYQNELKKLISSVGLVFNNSCFNRSIIKENLQESTDKAFYSGLPLMTKPYHRPFQYIGLPKTEIENIIDTKPNKAGNFVIEDERCRMFLESEGAFISYIELEIKNTLCKINQSFDSEPILGALSISLSELELVRKKIHYHTYYEHKRKLKVSVSCQEDGGNIVVGFSSKYYGM